MTARYIAGIAGTGATQHFVDNTGAPRMVLGDAVWALPGNAGRWNGGDWQADYDTYFATRAAQGYTVAYLKPIGTTQSGNIDDNGATFDGLYPFQGGAGANPSTGLTAAFWARIDYMLASALANGITVFFNAIGYNSDFNGGPGPLAGKSAAEFQAYGAALGARYKATPNMTYHLADDYFGGADNLITAFCTGLASAGDAHLTSIENYPETTSRTDLSDGDALPWGTAHAAYDFCYSYNVTYFGIEQAYKEAPALCVFQGDGYFYQGTDLYEGGGGPFAYDRAIRQDCWMALASGARGAIQGDESIWQWGSTSLAQSATNWWQANSAGRIRAAVEALPGWQLLLPDLDSTLVTSGRGTRATSLSSGGGGGQYEVAFSDTWIPASRTADGSLALIYFPYAATIGIDQSQMKAGYTATWVDPVNGAAVPAVAGPSYDSAAQGNNSQGDPDWVLVLAGPAQRPASSIVPLLGCM